jgi:hypothetical protein
VDLFFTLPLKAFLAGSSMTPPTGQMSWPPSLKGFPLLSRLIKSVPVPHKSPKLSDKTSDTVTGNSSVVTTPSKSIAMPHGPPHCEHHSSHSDFVRDAIIGFADGLTVPFALTAGLSV